MYVKKYKIAVLDKDAENLVRFEEKHAPRKNEYEFPDEGFYWGCGNSSLMFVNMTNKEAAVVLLEKTLYGATQHLKETKNVIERITMSLSRVA